MFVNNYTIGSDVEFFITDGKEIVSGEGVIPGTKENPHKIDGMFAVSLDNIMAEGNIPPVKNSRDFYYNLYKIREEIDRILPVGLKTIAVPAARINPKFLQTEHARTFGCDPSINCWDLEIIIPEPSEDNLRSAGFHIHIGYDNPEFGLSAQLARAMDLYLAIPSLLIEPENDRRKVGYGCAGNFREQPHGMEYRVLSTYFSSKKSLIEWSFENTELAIEFVNNRRGPEVDDLGLEEIINSENREEAEKLVKKFEVPLPNVD